METADFEIADSDTADHADNNIPYTCLSDLDSVISKLQKKRVSRWFHENNVISNPEKSHLIVSSKENLEIQVSSCFMKKKAELNF